MQLAFQNAARLQVESRSFATALTSLYGSEVNALLSGYLTQIGVVDVGVGKQLEMGQTSRLNIHLLHQILRHNEQKWLLWKFDRCVAKVSHGGDGIRYGLPCINSLFRTNITNEANHAPKSKPIDAAMVLFLKDFNAYRNATIDKLNGKIGSGGGGASGGAMPSSKGSIATKLSISESKSIEVQLESVIGLVGDKSDPNEAKISIFHNEQLPLSFQPFINLPLLQLPLPLLRSISSQLQVLRWKKIGAKANRNKNAIKKTTTTSKPPMSARERLLAGLDSGLGDNDDAGSDFGSDCEQKDGGDGADKNRNDKPCNHTHALPTITSIFPIITLLWLI
jgi:hypothetical protein